MDEGDLPFLKSAPQTKGYEKTRWLLLFDFLSLKNDVNVPSKSS
jgi:hypothetical protein